MKLKIEIDMDSTLFQDAPNTQLLLIVGLIVEKVQSFREMSVKMRRKAGGVLKDLKFESKVVHDGNIIGSIRFEP